jgi:uncharacterized protein
VRHLASFPLRRPVWTLVLMAIVTVLLGLGLLRLRQDTSAEAFLPRGHQSYEDKKRIDEIFGINDSILVAIIDRREGSVYNPGALALVEEISEVIASIPGIERNSVRSLATWEDISGTEEGFVVDPFLDPFPTTEAEARAVRQRVDAFPLYQDLLVSKDGSVAFVLADVRQDVDIIELFHRVRDYIDTRVDGERFAVHLTGPPVVTGTLNVYLNRDALVLDPISAAVTLTLLFLIFRSLQAVLLPFSVILPSIVAALGLMAWTGAPFTPFSNAIPVVILAVGLADSIHLLGTFFERRQSVPEETVREGVAWSLDRLWKPIFFTSVTTAAGFLSLRVTSPMVPVQDFGVAVAAGVLAAMVLSLTVLPALLVLFAPAVPGALRRRAESGRSIFGGIERVMLATHRLVTHRPSATLSVLGAGILLVSLGAIHLRADYDPVDFFPESSEVAVDYRAISGRFAGTNFIDLLFDTGTPEGVFDPDFLQVLAALQEDAEAWPQVGKTLSMVQYLERMNRAVHADDPAYHRLGDSTQLNAQLFLLFGSAGDPGRLEELVDPAQRQAHVRIFLRTGRDSENRELIEWLRNRLAADFPKGNYVLGGEAYVNHHWMRLIERSVWQSIGLMLGFMLLVGWLMLRSLRATLLSLTPVTAGLAVTYGIMGYMGTPLGLATSIFASIALGIGVDFAIHYMVHYRRSYRETGDHEETTREVLVHTGSILASNATVVVGGFLVLLFAKTVPPAQIGLYVAVGVGTSLATTLVGLSTLTGYLAPKRSRTRELTLSGEAT